MSINILSTNGHINSTNGRKTLARSRGGLDFYFSNRDVPNKKTFKTPYMKTLTNINSNAKVALLARSFLSIVIFFNYIAQA